MRFFSTPVIQAEMVGSSFSGNLLDTISTWFIFIFAEVKFVSMFSMLFGIGFVGIAIGASMDADAKKKGKTI